MSLVTEIMDPEERNEILKRRIAQSDIDWFNQHCDGTGQTPGGLFRRMRLAYEARVSSPVDPASDASNPAQPVQQSP